MTITPHAIDFFHKAYTIQPNGCWLWHRGKHGAGYGQLYCAGGPVLAHRLSWQLHYGLIPDGMDVLHDCPGGDNRACVNPKHLWIGTASENISDAVTKGRMPIGESVKNSKLTASAVIEMRRLRSEVGWTYQAIADRFHINNNTAYLAVNRRTWKHV